MKYLIVLSANTVAFFCCRFRLKMLLEIKRKVTVRLPDVKTGKLSGFKYELICHFKLAADIVGVASGGL